MPGPCKVCGMRMCPMVKDKRGNVTFACAAHHEKITGEKK